MVLDYTYKTIAGVSAKSRLGQHKANGQTPPSRTEQPEPSSEVRA